MEATTGKVAAITEPVDYGNYLTVFLPVRSLLTLTELTYVRIEHRGSAGYHTGEQGGAHGKHCLQVPNAAGTLSLLDPPQHCLCHSLLL